MENINKILKKYKKGIDISTFFVYDYTIDMIEARKTRVRFPVVPGRGRERKGDFAEAGKVMPDLPCRAVGEYFTDCRPLWGGALL